MLAAPIRVALVDTNVFFPARLADLVLSLAADGHFDLCTSDPLVEEARRVLVEHRGSAPEHVRRFCDRLRDVGEHHVSKPRCEEVCKDLAGPDADDLVHLAAAIHAQADYVVTSNTKDFLAAVIAPGLHRPTVITPDDFLMVLIDESGVEEFAATFERMRQRLSHPPLACDELLDRLERSTLKRAVATLRFHFDTFLPVAVVEGTRSSD